MSLYRCDPRRRMGLEVTVTSATTTLVRLTPSTPGNIGSAKATRIAESLAATDARGKPLLSQPTIARGMTFQAAPTAIGSSEDYAHAPSAPVWLVHVYGTFGVPMGRPPRILGTTAPTTSAPLTTSPSRRSYFVIIDAITGEVAVENY